MRPNRPERAKKFPQRDHEPDFYWLPSTEAAGRGTAPLMCPIQVGVERLVAATSSLQENTTNALTLGHFFYSKSISAYYWRY